MLEEQIRLRLKDIHDRIRQAAERANRDHADTKLVVVSKKQNTAVIQAAINAGITIFGENYPEEMIEKRSQLVNSGKIKWHMIGHLQSRKAKIVASHFDYFHSLDSVTLAEKMNNLCGVQGRILPVLLQFNMSGEETKSGWAAWDQVAWQSLVQEILPIFSLQHIQVNGLMTMPPLFTNPEKARTYFSALKRLRDFLEEKIPDAHLKELSMGTSNDFEVAVEEGATFIRLGEAILGPRDYK